MCGINAICLGYETKQKGQNMTMSVVVGLVAMCCAMSGTVRAQEDRSIVFQVEDQSGTTIVLSLDDQNFASSTYDGSLTFSGTVETLDGGSYDLTINTNIWLLNRATPISTTSPAGKDAVGAAQDSGWVTATLKQVMPSGSVSETQIQTSNAETQLFVEGDYEDLENVTAGLYNAGNFEQALAHCLTLLTTGPGDGPVGDGGMNLATCRIAAEETCGEDCLQSVTVGVTFNENGHVASTSCSFECKDPCPPS